MSTELYIKLNYGLMNKVKSKCEIVKQDQVGKVSKCYIDSTKLSMRLSYFMCLLKQQFIFNNGAARLCSSDIIVYMKIS